MVQARRREFQAIVYTDGPGQPMPPYQLVQELQQSLSHDPGRYLVAPRLSLPRSASRIGRLYILFHVSAECLFHQKPSGGLTTVALPLNHSLGLGTLPGGTVETRTGSYEFSLLRPERVGDTGLEPATSTM